MNKKSLALLSISAVFTVQCSSPQAKNDRPQTLASEEVHSAGHYALERAPSADRKKYKPGKELCGGYPSIGTKMPAGLCAGIVFDGSDLWKMARATVPYRESAFVLDMGGWGVNAGSLWRLDKVGGVFKARRILGPSDLGRTLKRLLDRPSGMVLGPDGKIWVGAAGTIWTFSPEDATDTRKLRASIKIVLANLSSTGLHALKHFAFENARTLLVNQGAVTNNCAGDPGSARNPKVCVEAENHGAIYRYAINSDGSYSTKKYALGLRNSMALAVDPRNGFVYQAENSRDAIDKVDRNLNPKLLPHEEINRIEEGGNYGWPYCYDAGVVSPEYKGHGCSAYKTPIALLPAHSAPLGMIFYQGKMLPPWYKNKMLITLHGYERMGHRLAVVDVDTEGRVVGKPMEFMGGWSETETQPKGSPVGIFEATDGSLWVTEDKNGTVIRIAYDAAKGDGIPTIELKDDASAEPIEDVGEVEKRRRAMEERLKLPKPPLFTVFQKEIVDTSCVECHGGREGAEPKLHKHDDLGNAKRLVESGLVVAKDASNSQFYTSILEGRMPKGDFDLPTDAQKRAMRTRALDLLKRWIDQGAP